MVDCSQNRQRDNILISLREEDTTVPFIEENESAISELDEENDQQLDLINKDDASAVN